MAALPPRTLFVAPLQDHKSTWLETEEAKLSALERVRGKLDPEQIKPHRSSASGTLNERARARSIETARALAFRSCHTRAGT